MKREDFSKTVTKGGYTVYYKGYSIGGAMALNGGKNLKNRKAIDKQIFDYSEMAERDIKHLIDGRGHEHMKLVIKKIDNHE